MMSDKIDGIQKQYMYTVQPVRLFESENSQRTRKSSYDLNNQMNLNKSVYNPSHPNVKSGMMANKLDILG